MEERRMSRARLAKRGSTVRGRLARRDLNGEEVDAVADRGGCRSVEDERKR